MHNENSSACERACEKAKGEDENDYVEQDILWTLIVTKKAIFISMN